MKTMLYISFILCITACTSKPTYNVDKLMQDTLEKRFTDLKNKERSDCRSNAILEADIYVDSIIYQMTRFSVLEDSINMISKPSRPNRPDYIQVMDKGPILPFEPLDDKQ